MPLVGLPGTRAKFRWEEKGKPQVACSIGGSCATLCRIPAMAEDLDRVHDSPKVSLLEGVKPTRDFKYSALVE